MLLLIISDLFTIQVEILNSYQHISIINILDELSLKMFRPLYNVTVFLNIKSLNKKTIL